MPKNHRSPFYLLRNIHGIDKILKQVKYPHEVNKRQRTLTAYVHYNANEFRSLATYPLIYILQNQFKEKKYYYNLVKYLLFLRLLRQDFVPDIDINNSQILINSFLEEFQELYGTKNLSYNMHANLHLPKQVRKHGSLPKLYQKLHERKHSNHKYLDQVQPLLIKYKAILFDQINLRAP